MFLSPWLAQAEDSPIIAILGDSLSAGYGISEDQGWVVQLQRRLADQGYPHRVINASVSGITTHGALGRSDAIFARHRPTIVIVELGGNDGLNGLPLDATRRDLGRIIENAKQAGAKVLLVKMRMLPNLGPQYTQRFESIYDALPDQHAIAVAPFILSGIVDRPELMQADKIHPKAEAQVLMLDNLWPSLVPLL